MVNLEEHTSNMKLVRRIARHNFSDNQIRKVEIFHGDDLQLKLDNKVIGLGFQRWEIEKSWLRSNQTSLTMRIIADLLGISSISSLEN